tara:strand:- start:464 stop:994 length:531 start_codon:yes stop_codon:yes gene_type:complete
MVTTNQVEQLRKFYDAFIIEPSGHIQLKEDQKETYQSFVRELHDDELPNNWRYTIITDLLQNFVNEYEQDQLEDCLSEIVDSLVDVYNIDLIEWLKGDIMRGSFLEIRELNIDQPNMTIFDLIRQMQYEVIYSMADKILNHQYQTFEEFHEQRIKEEVEIEDKGGWTEYLNKECSN